MPFERWLHVVAMGARSLFRRRELDRGARRRAAGAPRSSDRGQRCTRHVAGGRTPRGPDRHGWRAAAEGRVPGVSRHEAHRRVRAGRPLRGTEPEPRSRLHPRRHRHAHTRHRRERRGVRGRQRRAAAAAALPAAGSALPRGHVAAEPVRHRAGPLGSQLRGVARPRPRFHQPGDLLHVRGRPGRRRRSGGHQGGQRHDGILRRPGRRGGVRADLQRRRWQDRGRADGRVERCAVETALRWRHVGAGPRRDVERCASGGHRHHAGRLPVSGRCRGLDATGGAPLGREQHDVSGDRTAEA